MSASPIQEIVAVFGEPVAGNPSQYVMEGAFARAGIDWRFLTLEVSAANLADAVKGAKAMGFRGFDCASPHEEAVVPLLDRLSEVAEAVGAVNCVRRETGALVGDNTHGKGFLRAVTPLVDPRGKRVALLGAGKMARAVAVELALAGAAEIRVVNRDVGRGEALAKLLSERMKIAAAFTAWSDVYRVPAETDLLVNASSLGGGSSRKRMPIGLELLGSSAVVADVSVNPPSTRLLREATERNLRTVDGVSMLVHQTAESFTAWTGAAPDLDLIRESLEEFLGV